MGLPVHIARLRGMLVILVFYLAGGALSRWTGHVVPGSVIGMLLLFGALMLRIVHPDIVRDASHLLTSTMALFFIPAVGVMMYWDLLRDNLLVIAAACVASSVLVIASVGWIQELFERTGADE